MPYKVGRHASCGKPFAVIRVSDGKKVGCFSSRKSAEAQIGQLEVREGMRKEGGYLKLAYENTDEDRAEVMLKALAVEDEIESEELIDELPDDEVHKSLTERFFDYLGGNVEKTAIKRENGLDFPPRDYAFVPDRNSPSTWKIRLTETPGKVTATQLGRAVAALSAGGFRGNRVDIPAAAMSAVKRRVRAEYRRLGIAEDKIPNAVKETSRFSLWKQADGQYRWFAVYSNAFRDNDGVPEIIAKESHELFVDMVDSGLVPMPELWHYHIPGTRWGVADWLGFSDGFALASGTVDAGHEKEAETLAEMDDIGVSHGMPLNWIMRDETDPTIITMHVTQEISPLPLSAAANKLTTFFVKENEDMALSKQKRDHLVSLGFTDERIDALESGLQKTADAAIAAGIESKETTPNDKVVSDAPAETVVVPVAPAVPDVQTTDTQDEGALRNPDQPTPPVGTDRTGETNAGTDAPETDAPAKKSADEAPLTRGEIAEALKSFGELIAARLDTTDQAISMVVSEVKSLKEEDAAKIAKAAEVTPAMSITDMLAGMFTKQAVVDGRTALGRDKPAEVKKESSEVTGLPYLDALFSTTPQE